ncbi:MAG TPA: glycosyltransferase family 9 protein [Candidatus Nanoarchaeia archaeon]|nr:glycosyltransferase family 9 protein [Candidatus Nanoarchaeia archaeon]
MTKIDKILYTSPRGIGDVMFSLPLLHSLREAYSQARIYVPIPRDKQDVLNLVGFIEPTSRFLPKPSEDPLARERWQASVNEDTREKYRLEKLIYEKYLNGEEYDLALIPKDFKIDTIDCPTQINQDDLREEGFLPTSGHMVNRFLSFADYGGIPRKYCFDLGFDKSKEIRLNSGWTVKSDKPYIVFNLGASVGKKTWTAKGFRETAEWAHGNGFNVILVGDNASYDGALEIQGNDQRILNTVLKDSYSFNLQNFARLASRSSAVISGDTGMLHVADAAGARVIGLYGPTDPERYAPFNNKQNVVSRNGIDNDAKNIKASQVIEKLEEVVKK